MNHSNSDTELFDALSSHNFSYTMKKAMMRVHKLQNSTPFVWRLIKVATLLWLVIVASCFVQPQYLPRRVHATTAVQRATSTFEENASVTTELEKLKSNLLSLADRTDRGFRASKSDRNEANELIAQLSRYFDASTIEPARDYYSATDQKRNMRDEFAPPKPSLCGKWTLVYTDAPDITGLDPSINNPFPVPTLATLGRIGQDNCEPPFIKNVIEWARPEWIGSLPLPSFLVGKRKSDRENDDDDVKILQYVVTEARASPEQPSKVQLKVVGLQVEAKGVDAGSVSGQSRLLQGVQNAGWLPGLLANQPIDFKSPVKAPFGEFEVLYLDEDMRIVRTGQNYIAVNIRSGSDWF